MKRLVPAAVLLLFLCAARGADKLVVHEWGTFTSLQDEGGNAVGGINVDDEPLPSFVHRIGYNLMLPFVAPEPPASNGKRIQGYAVLSKGLPSLCDQDVTMRLETPVVYFHPPADWKPQTVDLHVAFKGGWLSEYYPDAIFRAPGFDRAKPDQVYSNDPAQRGYSGIGRLKPETVGELSWKGLTIRGDRKVSEVQVIDKVWLAPRDVNASAVSTGSGESEMFLFYRGVANANAALRIVRNPSTNTLKVSDQSRGLEVKSPETNLQIPAAWLVEVRPDGKCAFKSCGALKWGAPTRATFHASFDPDVFSAQNIPKLKEEMRAALIKQGLFPDEANALLNTWEISYFRNPGTRFFYLCPRVDVEAALPLEVSVSSEITRVMVGRIEIVTPAQRTLLKKISADPAPLLGVANRAESETGYDDYVKLGRFRNALILDEFKRRPTPMLSDFIQKNHLEALTVESPKPE